MKELIEQIGGRKRLVKLVAQYDEDGYCDVQDDEVISALRALLAVLDAKPTYYIHRVEARDSYGPEVDMRVFTYELDASKCKDDHGGEVIEVFTTPQSASVPDGWKLMPLKASPEILQAGIKAHYERQKYQQPEDVKFKGPMECAYDDMLSAAPAPGGDGG